MVSRAMHRHALLAASLCALSVGCVGDDSSDSNPDEVAPIASVTIPPERLTPFCQAMIDLNVELDRSVPPEDEGAFILDRYRAIQPDVPAAIAADFAAVIEALETGQPPPSDPPVSVASSTAVPPATTEGSLPPEGDAFFEEGYQPGASPAERISDYVSFECTDTGNNPGPPATQPLDDVVLDDVVVDDG